MKHFNYNKEDNVVEYKTEVCTYYKDPTDYDTMPYDFEIDWSDFWEACEDIVGHFPLGIWEEEPKTIEEKIAFIEDIEKEEGTERFNHLLSKLDDRAQDDFDSRENDYYDDYEPEPDWDYLERTIWWNNEK